jgi:TorA maturation chaperone TorD
MPAAEQLSDQLTDQLRFRAYRSLSRLFAYVTEPDDVTAAAEAVEELAGALAGLKVEAEPVLRQAKAWLAAKTREEILRELRVSYTRLFVTAYPRVPAPPYGSVYLDGGNVWGKSTVAALKMYRAHGRELLPSFLEPPDHFGAELEFMSCLIAAAVNGEKDASRMRSSQKSFFQRHLGRWFSGFLDRVQRYDQEGFFGNIAAAARAFLEKEAQFFAEREGGSS